MYTRIRETIERNNSGMVQPLSSGTFGNESIEGRNGKKERN
jgi:hypothetical protein